MTGAAAEITPSPADSPPPHTAPPLLGRGAGARVCAVLGLVLFLTMLPVTMMVPVLKELVAERFGVGTLWTHLFMTINMVGAIVTAPFSAALADRAVRRRTVLLVALTLNAGTLLLMPAVSSFALFMVLRFIEGALHVLAVSTVMAAALDWTPQGRRGRTMGLIGAALVFGTACGAPLGGQIGQTAPTFVLLLGGAFVLIAAGLTFLWVRESPRRLSSARLADTFHLLRKRRALLAPYAFAFVDRFCVGVIVSSFVLFLSDVHGYTPAQRGGLLALFLFPFALLCYPAGRLADRIGRAFPIIVGNAAFGVVIGAYGVVPASWLPMLMLASGVFSAMLFTPNLALCADLAPPDQRTVAYAGFNMAGSLGFLCGPLAGGLILTLLPSYLSMTTLYAGVFGFAGLTVVTCVILSARILIRHNRSACARESGLGQIVHQSERGIGRQQNHRREPAPSHEHRISRDRVEAR